MDEPVPLARLREEIAHDLAGGAAALDGLLAEWSSCGLIELLPDRPGSAPADGALALIESPAGPARMQCLGTDCDWFAPYSHLSSDGEQAPVIDACGQIAGTLGLIRIEGGRTRIVPRELLAATFRFHLVEALLEHNQSVALHCAVLVKEGSAIVLMGPPGTGKSTMTLFAGRAGFAIGGDDIAFLDNETQSVAALALPLTLKSGSREKARGAGFPIDTTRIVPRNDGVDVLYLPIPNDPIGGAIPVRAIVRLDRSDEKQPALRAWTKTDCLDLLCREARSRSGSASIETFRALLGMVEQAETLVLSYDEAEHAVSLLERHVSG
ncbi:hypothetical protein [Aurantiacibacter hainanensis]|uniref:hypothetical protein n=1 Tax=Aurantiacibacter hainanensis TaxID=3076114 RepID=UPI0030C69000